jgi:UDP-glucose 4-epimerase
MTEEAALTDAFKNKTLMITGGTGSFGSTVLRRFLNSGLKEIRIFSRDEKKQEDMRIAINDPKVKFYIGDVRNLDSVCEAMKGVDFVFHAAALKQVPSCEFYPLEAVRTNVLGTQNVITAAIDAGVERVIALSTDKAVYPVNAMGLSKALMEKLVVAKARSHSNTVVCITRYGNVMASRGSVIPLFVNQIAENKPLTVTDPQMTRFLMSLEDAVDLVIYAFQHAEPGDTFIQKAPASTIGDLAEAVRQLFNSKAPLKIIGTRHGEKLYESLLSREEMARAIDMGRYYRLPADNRDLNYNKYFTEGQEKVARYEDYTSHNTERLNVEQIKDLLRKQRYVAHILAGGKASDYSELG